MAVKDDRVLAELTAQSWVLLGAGLLAGLVGGLLLARARRRSSAQDATLAALAEISEAAPALRDGLDQHSAETSVPALRRLLGCTAVALHNSDGALLAWDGSATRHAEELQSLVHRSISEGGTQLVEHGDLNCRLAECRMRQGLVVPLECDEQVAGSLLMISEDRSNRAMQSARKVARFLSTQLELAELEESRSRLAQAEVKALRAQISPHFVYNALTTIASFVRSDPPRARELVLEFADFTRYSFRSTGEYTTLSDELTNIDRYLALERARFGDRLGVRLQIAQEVLGVELPFLALQPLVENAVRHGLAEKPEGGTVAVIAEDLGSEVGISVEDDGVGMDPKRLESDLSGAHQSGAHVGLGNVDDRLRSAFGAGYGLVVETGVDAGTKISMRVPKFRAAPHG